MLIKHGVNFYRNYLLDNRFILTTSQVLHNSDFLTTAYNTITIVVALPISILCNLFRSTFRCGITIVVALPISILCSLFRSTSISDVMISVVMLCKKC